MVALAIGLVVVLIATTIYLQGVSNFGFRMGQSENLGNSRYVLGTLDLALSRAGYRRDPTQAMGAAFPANASALANGCQFAQGEAIDVVDEQTLCIRFQARDDEETDCAGAGSIASLNLAAYEAPPANRGILVEKYRFDSASGKLVCQAGGQDDPAQQEVADGVRGLHFEFGVGPQSDSFAARRVESFKTTLPAAGETLRSLRYAVLLASSGGGLTAGMSSTVCERWTALGGAADGCDTGRGQLYQLATGSLTLRNLMP